MMLGLVFATGCAEMEGADATLMKVKESNNLPTCQIFMIYCGLRLNGSFGQDRNLD
jgi:hypothetical protein